MRGVRKRGLSLLELSFTVGLLGMSTAFFIMSGGSKMRGKVGVNSLADALVNDLAQARVLAIRQQSPVAIMFPSDNRPHSSSTYQLEGLTEPHVSRSQNFIGDFPNLCFFVGSWTGSETRDPLVSGTKWSNFPLERWIPNDRKGDYALIFMPDGTVRSNDLPQFNREYHIAVSAGVGSYQSAGLSGGSLPSAYQPALFRAQSLGETCTVCINAGGGIHVESGLAGTTTVPTVGTMRSNTPVSTPRQLTYIGEAEGNPKGTSSLPAPVDDEPTTIPPDGFVTLTTFAQDAAKSGQRLFCSWKVILTKTDSVKHGAYSIPVDSTKGAAMDFNPEANLGNAGLASAYQSTWQWRPPDDAKPGDIFTMSLLLQNQEKQLVEVDIKKVLKVLPYGSILYEFEDGPNRNLWRMNADGTGKRRFFIPPSKPTAPLNYHEFSPTSSADGNRIAFLSDNRPGVAAGFQDIFLTDRNGDNCYRVTTNQFCEAPGLSPAGDMVAFKRWNAGAGSYDLCVSSVAGGPIHVLRNSVTGVKNLDGANPAHRHFTEDRVAWLSDNRILFTDKDSTFVQIAAVQVNDNGTLADPNPGQPAHASAGTWSPYWSPRTGSIYYTRDDPPAGDPWIGRGGSGYSWSEGWIETEAHALQYGSEEWLLTVRSRLSNPGEEQIYLIQPVAGGYPSQVRQLTNSATGQSRWPIYLP
jgi:hypothetical protein